MKRLKKTYNISAAQVAEEIRAAELAGLSDITSESWQRIQSQILAGQSRIAATLEPEVLRASKNGVDQIASINTEYISDAIRAVPGAEELISLTRIENSFFLINEEVVRSIVNRVSQSGYTFSQSVWRNGEYYDDMIKQVVAVGVNQGRDVVKIARDVQVYVADGKVRLIKRLGPNLRPGSPALINRIGKNVDWRALRLVRSELYASLQEVAVEQGRRNPAAIGLYVWVLELGRSHWNCPCPDLAADSPYQLEEVPDYPHTNCRCDVRPVMMDRREFQADLKRWVNGEPVDYLDEWSRVYNSIMKACRSLG